MGQYLRAAALSDVPEGELLAVEVAGRKLCLANVDGEIYAFQDNCSHRDFPLHQGELDTDDCTITCEWHGATFDVRTGAARSLPATRPIQVFAVQVEDGAILVEVG